MASLIAWVLAALLVVLFLKAMSWRSRAEKGTILGLLLKRGPLTGAQLLDMGLSAGVQTRLRELEREGFVDCHSDGVAHEERGGRPRFYYRISEGLRGR